MPPKGKDSTECVKVVVRCRPLSSKEVDEGRQRIVDVDLKSGQMSVKNTKAGGNEPPKTYTFDLVYDWNTLQANLYEEAAAPIVDNVMEGYNGTIFAYGQTGTGKTHTMEGRLDPAEEQGIIPRSFRHIFDSINGLGKDKEYLVRASFLEIYNEDIRDLLSKNPSNKLELKESVDTGVYVKDLTSFVVKGVSEINNVLAVGKKNRTVGATLMNQDSSRSHSIFTVTVETSDKVVAGAESHIRVGKLNLVDLAGSERQSKTGATGDRLKEATKINLSLSALGNVISALVDGKSAHIPYRDSKLTRLLQDSLGGNTKTVMCANIGPADYNFEETISTLRYANRAKNIQNKPKINEDPKDTMLREFQEEIARLKNQLMTGGPGGGAGGLVTKKVIKEKEMDEDEITAIKEQTRRDLEAKMRASVTQEAMVEAKKEAEKHAHEEMQALLADQKKTEAEKEKIREEMAKHQEELNSQLEEAKKEKAARKALAKKLKAMEDKLMAGGAEQSVQDLVEQRKIRQEELDLKRQEMDRQKEKEALLAAKVAAVEEKQLNVEETYSSLQDEADAKSKKLKKLFNKFQTVAETIQDIREEQQREREEMLDSARTLTRQLKLKELIISAFVPREESEKVKQAAIWDDEHECWVLERLRKDVPEKSAKAKRPVSASGLKRPMSDYAKIASAMGDQVGGSNPRFKSENILNLELDMPERTTYDYEGPGMNPRVQAAINAAFADDSEMLPASYIPVSAPVPEEKAKPARPGSARRKSQVMQEGAEQRRKSQEGAEAKPARVARPSSAKKQANGVLRSTSKESLGDEDVYPESRSRHSSGSR